jgi:hypothetical protein
MQTLVFAIIGCFALIFVGSLIASILYLWIHQEYLTDYPRLSDIRRRRR